MIEPQGSERIRAGSIRITVIYLPLAPIALFA